MNLKKIELTEIDKDEVFRYAQSKKTDILDKLLDECIDELKDNIDSNVVFDEVYINIDKDDIDLSFTKTKSHDLAENLSTCKVAVVFACTIGMGIDRLIKKYSQISPSKALMFQALGAERVENLAENFSKFIADEYARLGFLTKRRFSPGYGDLPLELQKDIIPYLETEKKIGIKLNDSLLMSPSKSVTAFIGLQDIFMAFDVVEQGGDDCTSDCATCHAKDCLYKKD